MQLAYKANQIWNRWILHKVKARVDKYIPQTPVKPFQRLSKTTKLLIRNPIDFTFSRQIRPGRGTKLGIIQETSLVLVSHGDMVSCTFTSWCPVRQDVSPVRFHGLGGLRVGALLTHSKRVRMLNSDVSTR